MTFWENIKKRSCIGSIRL